MSRASEMLHHPRRALPPPCSCAAAPSQERVRTACTKRRLLLIISSNTSCIHLETTQREGIAKNCTQHIHQRPTPSQSNSKRWLTSLSICLSHRRERRK
ncbi:unnamed protein product [Musa acuminata subsp. malaccensis]|uniref:(wild Malaysian banana) hypothetical protein n=1 Tax=Musa acuminata subsp. malaccensis TaxID=214687 RepID=A0A804K0C8_MUSAM|nr:unnamed protein product [Musa acuminata subsp. malaccensis]